MELIGNDVIGAQTGQGFEMHPQTHRIPAGGAVGTGTTDERLENRDMPGLGALENVNGMVQFNLGFLDAQAQVVPGAGPKQDNIPAPYGTGYGDFHFPVGETVGFQHTGAVDYSGHRGKTWKLEQIFYYPFGIALYGTGSGNDKFIHLENYPISSLPYFPGFA
jgi:hypothetical protein